MGNLGTMGSLRGKVDMLMKESSIVGCGIKGYLMEQEFTPSKSILKTH